jgi:hypothetical protein
MLGVLPIEEIIFFLLTNTLIVFGATLVLAEESQERAPDSVLKWMARFARRPVQSHPVKTKKAENYSHV